MKQSSPISLQFPLLGTLLFLALLCGCSGSKQYVAFARDGASCAASVAALADRSSALRIESSSFTLLQQRRELFTTYKGMALKNALRASLQERNRTDMKAIENKRYTKELATSLRDYFIALEELAASTAPAETGAKTSEIMGKLDALLSAKNIPHFSLPPPVAPVMVSSVTNRGLRHEIVSRKESLLKALDILDALLITMSQDMDGDAKSIRNGRVALLLQPAWQDTTAASLLSLSDRKLWITLRQKELLGSAIESDDKRSIMDAKQSTSTFRGLLMKMTAE